MNTDFIEKNRFDLTKNNSTYDNNTIIKMDSLINIVFNDFKNNDQNFGNLQNLLNLMRKTEIHNIQVSITNSIFLSFLSDVLTSCSGDCYQSLLNIIYILCENEDNVAFFISNNFYFKIIDRMDYINIDIITKILLEFIPYIVKQNYFWESFPFDLYHCKYEYTNNDSHIESDYIYVLAHKIYIKIAKNAEFIPRIDVFTYNYICLEEEIDDNLEYYLNFMDCLLAKKPDNFIYFTRHPNISSFDDNLFQKCFRRVLFGENNRMLLLLNIIINGYQTSHKVILLELSELINPKFFKDVFFYYINQSKIDSKEILLYHVKALSYVVSNLNFGSKSVYTDFFVFLLKNYSEYSFAAYGSILCTIYTTLYYGDLSIILIANDLNVFDFFASLVQIDRKFYEMILKSIYLIFTKIDKENKEKAKHKLAESNIFLILDEADVDENLKEYSKMLYEFVF